MLFRELSKRSQGIIVDTILGIDRDDVTEEDREEIRSYLEDDRNIGEGRIDG